MLAIMVESEPTKSIILSTVLDLATSYGTDKKLRKISNGMKFMWREIYKTNITNH